MKNELIFVLYEPLRAKKYKKIPAEMCQCHFVHFVFHTFFSLEAYGTRERIGVLGGVKHLSEE